MFPKLCLDTELGCEANISEGEAAASLAGSSAEGKALLCWLCLLLGGYSLGPGALCSQGEASLKARKLPRAL